MRFKLKVFFFIKNFSIYLFFTNFISSLAYAQNKMVTVDISADSQKIDSDYLDHEFLYDILSYRYNEYLLNAYNEAQFGYRTSYGSLDGYNFYIQDDLKLEIEEDNFGLRYNSNKIQDFVSKKSYSEFEIFRKFSLFGSSGIENEENSALKAKIGLVSSAQFEKKYSDVGFRFGLLSKNKEIFYYQISNLYAVYNWKEKNKQDHFKSKPWRHLFGGQFDSGRLFFSSDVLWETPIEWNKNSKNTLYQRSFFQHTSSFKYSLVGKDYFKISFQNERKYESLDTKLQDESLIQKEFSSSFGYFGYTNYNEIWYELYFSTIHRNSNVDLKKHSLNENEISKSVSEAPPAQKNDSTEDFLVGGKSNVFLLSNIWNIGLDHLNTNVVRVGPSVALVDYQKNEIQIEKNEKNIQKKQSFQSKLLTGWEYRFKNYGMFGFNVSWDIDNLLRKPNSGNRYSALWDGGNFQMGLFF
jgi:hypothetical protein